MAAQADDRAAAWDGEAESPPPPRGDPERGEVFVLARVPASILASLPRG